MMPRSLRSTSWRFSRSWRPMRMRLRSSNRNRAEAFTSSTPRLGLRDTESSLYVQGKGPPASPQGPPAAPQGPPAAPQGPPASPQGPPAAPTAQDGPLHQSLRKVASLARFLPPPKSLSPGRGKGTLLCSGPENGAGRGHGPCLPPSWLAPGATEQQQNSQQHERSPRPVETGAAVVKVEEAASPRLLEQHDRQEVSLPARSNVPTS